MIFNYKSLTKALKEARDIKGAIVRYMAEGDQLIIAGDNIHLTLSNIGAKSDTTDFSFPDGALRFIDALENEDIIIALACGNMTVKQGKAKAKFLLPTAEPPTLPAMAEGVDHAMNAAELRNVLSMVHYAVSVQDLRPALTSIRLRRREDGRLCAEASDGYQIARAETIQTQSGEAPFDLLFSMPSCSKLLGLINGDTVTMREDGRRALLAGEGWQLCCALTAAAPIDFDRVFVYGKEADEMEYDREALLKMFGRAKIALGLSKEPIRLRFDGITMTASLQGAACEFMDEAEERRRVPITKNNLRIGFNLNHLCNAISHSQTDTVQLLLAGDTSPMIIRALCEETGIVFQAVTLPVRLQVEAV